MCCCVFLWISINCFFHPPGNLFYGTTVIVAPHRRQTVAHPVAAAFTALLPYLASPIGLSPSTSSRNSNDRRRRWHTHTTCKNATHNTGLRCQPTNDNEPSLRRRHAMVGVLARSHVPSRTCRREKGRVNVGWAVQSAPSGSLTCDTHPRHTHKGTRRHRAAAPLTCSQKT